MWPPTTVQADSQRHPGRSGGPTVTRTRRYAKLNFNDVPIVNLAVGKATLATDPTRMFRIADEAGATRAGGVVPGSRFGAVVVGGAET
jgi:hypothetical protein